MYKINLNDSEVEAIKASMEKESSIKVYRRLQSLLMKNQGIKNNVIAAILDVSGGCLTGWFKLYIEGGLEKLGNLNYGHNSISKLDKYQDELRVFIKENKIKNSVEINDFLKKKHGLEISNSWLVKYLKKNSIFPIKKPS